MSDDPEGNLPDFWLARYPYGDECGGTMTLLDISGNPKTVDDLRVDASAYLHVNGCPGCRARYGGIRRLN